ncbi:MAG: heme o synthase [Planctomycetaceae bacterium]
MSTPITSVRSASGSGTLSSRLSDYLEITKPRISVMVLVTVSVGFALGSFGHWDPVTLLHAVFGIALVATASSAFNQVLERNSDAMMRRTSDRPIPSGRMSATEVAMFGAACGIVGSAWLLLFVNTTTAALTAMTFVLYVCAYTPLKSRSYLCTTIGAIPGALPPVLGWTAAGAPLDARPLALFGILFLWQFPHFLAIAYRHREDYERAGLKMLPGNGIPKVVGWMAICYALLLLPVSLMPSAVSLAGVGYFSTAIVLGIGYVIASIRFMQNESRQTARALILTSLVYLPVLLLVLTWDHFSLLQ